MGTVCHVAFLFNIQANIHLLKKGKARKYKTHSFYGNKKKTIPIVTLVPDVGQQVFCHVLFEGFFLIRLFRLRLKCGFRIKAFTL